MDKTELHDGKAKRCMKSLKDLKSHFVNVTATEDSSVSCMTHDLLQCNQCLLHTVTAHPSEVRELLPPYMASHTRTQYSSVLTSIVR